MRAQIIINKFGIIQEGEGKKPPQGGVLARRTNRDLVVHLHNAVTVPALLCLIQALRAVDVQMTLVGSTALPMTRAQICLTLARRALSIVEGKHEDLFMSDLEIFNKEISTIDILPKNLTKLVELNFSQMDAPSALMKASTAKVGNLVSVGQTRSMRLYFLALPENLSWPPDVPDISKPIDEVLSEPISTWLSIAYEAALSIQSPIYQHGILKINPELRLPFQRVLNPITPLTNRPAHFRILTTASVIGDHADDVIII